MDPRALLKQHPRAALAVGGAGVAVLVFVVVWFQPQQLFLDRSVDEALPQAGSEPMAMTDAEAPPAAPAVVAEGEFRSLEHSTTGKAVLVRQPGGGHLVRFEDLRTDNGPDLRVYLSTADASAEGRAYAEDFVDLGALKGNIGNQNYEVPADVDISRFRSVVIWCRRFTVGFGVASLV